MIGCHRVWRSGYGLRGGNGIHLVEIGKAWKLLKESVLENEACHDQGEGDEGRREPCAIRCHRGV